MIQTTQQPLQKRVGLVHVSSVIERLIKLYELQADVEAVEEQDAAVHFETEFGNQQPVAVAAPVPLTTQSTFGWFEPV